ncbi:hypothetical protein [Sinorhizobium sp. M4_45]|uniref:hypothetical protein n=1 Tax=Sinorhizobium sp. M4_45 TaxID=2037901 RepID=UPI000C9A6214|nr:hypothetical protein [Sinorhizobium sp. M4_45]PND26781.1 hypothetical protein CN933_13620 [Sinorhizobium sp. M4_45]
MLVIICVLVFVPVIFFNREPNTLVQWVYDYQTLIGGLFAIAAAYVTVVHMRASDYDNDRRHEDLMALSLRSERLQLDRAFSRIAYRRSQVDRLQLPKADLQASDSFEQRCQKILEIIPECIAARDRAQETREFLEREEVRTCEALFDGTMMAAREELKLAAQSLLIQFGQVTSARNIFRVANAGEITDRHESIRNAIYKSVMDEAAWDNTFFTFKDAAKAFFDQAERLWQSFHTVGSEWSSSQPRGGGAYRDQPKRH